MLAKISKYAVFILTVLVANYLGELFFQYTKAYQRHDYTSVLVGMLIVVAIYVPVFTFLEKYIKKLSESYLRTSKSMSKSKAQGVLIGFAVAFLVLFYLYARLWFGLHPINDLKAVFF